MIKTVVREHHWTPDKISGLYHDGIDHFGLKYWYEDVVKCIEEMKSKTPAPNA